MKKNQEKIFRIEVTRCELNAVELIPIIKITFSENKKLSGLLKEENNKFIISFEIKNNPITYSITGENEDGTFFSMKLNVANRHHYIFETLFNDSETWIIEFKTQNRAIELIIIKSTGEVRTIEEKLFS